MIDGLKTRLRWRGKDRGYLRLLQRAILYMTAREQRMRSRADAAGLEGFYFDDSADGILTDAMQTLMDRIDAALQERH